MDSLPEEVVYILKSVAEGRASELERVGLPSDYAEFTVSRDPRGWFVQEHGHCHHLCAARVQRKRSRSQPLESYQDETECDSKRPGKAPE